MQLRSSSPARARDKSCTPASFGYSADMIRPDMSHQRTCTVSKTIFILNGPNLNLLGQREPEVYGFETLGDIQTACEKLAQTLGLSVELFQSNHEGEIVEQVHQAREQAAGIIINPAAFTHTSVAILDALNAFDAPVIEVHISNIHKREEFRHHSYISGRADAVIAGCGTGGYTLALRHMATLVE
jgi:3-dehydroquinate dehydratase-2